MVKLVYLNLLVTKKVLLIIAIIIMLHNLVVSKIIVNIVRDYLYRDMPLLQSLIQLYRENP